MFLRMTNDLVFFHNIHCMQRPLVMLKNDECINLVDEEESEKDLNDFEKDDDVAIENHSHKKKRIL